MRSLLLALLILATFPISSGGLVVPGPATDSPGLALKEAWEKSSCQMVEAHVVGWTPWSSPNATAPGTDELWAMADQVRALLNLQLSSTGFQVKRGNKWNAVQVTGCLKNGTPVEGQLNLGPRRFLTPSGTDGNPAYLEISLVALGPVSVEEWVKCWHAISRLNPGLGLRSLLYFYGRMPGQVGWPQLRCRTQDMLAAAGAKLVEQAETPAWMSVSAYSRALPSTIYSRGKPLNLGIAWRYHSDDGYTYLTLGTPALPGEF